MHTFIAKLKNAWRSKTIWFNALMVALPSLLDQLSGVMPNLQPYMPANVFQAVTVSLIVGNVLLRFITRLPLEAK